MTDESGALSGSVNTVVEATDAVVTARRSRILNGELRHRIKMPTLSWSQSCV